MTEKVILKAIEGGWKYPDWFEEAYNAVPVDDEIADELLNRWAVLDPEFWKCLGKALGWADDTFIPPYFRIVGGEEIDHFLPNEREVAHRFYDLILTGGDTEKYWDELMR